jgi:hypothetical protein
MEETVGLVSTCRRDALRLMAASRPYGEFYDLYGVSPEYFGYTLIIYNNSL